MTAKNPVRQTYSSAKAVSGKDWSTQARDFGAALAALVPIGKIAYSGYARFPIALAVESAPWALLCVRIQPSNNKQAIAPQGGFCSFAYDAGAGVASVTSINALDASSAAPLSAAVLYDFSFLAVF